MRMVYTPAGKSYPYLGMAILDCCEQRCRIHVAPVLQQQFRHIHMPLLRCHCKRSAPSLRCLVHVQHLGRPRSIHLHPIFVKQLPCL